MLDDLALRSRRPYSSFRVCMSVTSGQADPALHCHVLPHNHAILKNVRRCIMDECCWFRVSAKGISLHIDTLLARAYQGSISLSRHRRVTAHGMRCANMKLCASTKVPSVRSRSACISLLDKRPSCTSILVHTPFCIENRNVPFCS